MTQVEQTESGLYKISGNLDFSTVTALLAQVHSLAGTDNSEMKVDLSALDRYNSAGLAFLLELVADARKQHRKISFLSVPEQLMDLARMSNVERFLLEK